MSKLLELASKLVKTINQNTGEILQGIKDYPEQHKIIMNKISALKNRIDEEKTSARLDFIICKVTKSSQTKSKTVKVIKNGEIVAIIADNTIKPEIKTHLEVLDIECKCTKIYQNANFCLHKIKQINETSYFNSMIGQPLLIRLYKHSYRSFIGFTCFILIVSENECLLLDTLVHRKIVHDIFKCGTLKYFHCEDCYNQFTTEFCNIGCYEIMDGCEIVYCDWRIRPYDIIMNQLIENDIEEMINDYKHFYKSLLKTQADRAIENKINDASLLVNETYNSSLVSQYESSLYTASSCDFDYIADQFISYYNISHDSKLLVTELIKLRNFIAKSNNESVFYTMTDDQLCKLVCNQPQTKEEFLQCLTRMSALAREHVIDFLMLIDKCAKVKKTEALFCEKNEISNSSSNSIPLNMDQRICIEYNLSDSTEELTKGAKKKVQLVKK